MRRRYSYTYYKRKQPKRKAKIPVILVFLLCAAVLIGFIRAAGGVQPAGKYTRVGESET